MMKDVMYVNKYLYGLIKDYKDRFKDDDNVTRLGLGTLNN